MNLRSGFVNPWFVLSQLVAVSLLLPVARADIGVASSRVGDASFVREVMPILSKAGCNMGACHGNRNGKGGLQLSLRGVAPQADYLVLVEELAGRRINRVAPAESLILLKATSRAPHEGGHRFDVDSMEFEILRRWIADGAPPPDSNEPPLVALHVAPGTAVVEAPQENVPLSVFARYADGTFQDVTRLAVYENSNLVARVSPDGVVSRNEFGESTIVVRFLQEQVSVRVAFVPRRDDLFDKQFVANNFVDELVWEKLQTVRIVPSELANDHTFVRRAFLDATGTLPTATEAQQFVADKSSDKRSRLIDRLVDRSEFAELWALRWSDVLRNEEKVLDANGVDAFHDWLKQQFARDTPLNEIVRELIIARGSTYENPPANFWRALRNPVARGETTAQVFLGYRLQCAKCHNHPLDRWTQEDYYRWAALFGRVDYKVVDNKKKDKLDKHEFIGEQIVQIRDRGEVKDVRTGKPAVPGFLGDEAPAFTPHQDRLFPTADWLTDRDNKQFARMQVNRIWYHMMGRGIVDPIDDFRVTNPASNPELLEALAQEFIDNNYSVKHLVRTIMKSRIYQLSSQPNATNTDDELNFSKAIVRRLPAEQLLDAQCSVLGVSAEFNGYEEGTRAGSVAGVERIRRRDKRPATGDRFLTVFGKPQRLLACECERTDTTTLAQALVLVGGEGLNERLQSETGRIHEMVEDDNSAEDIVRELYWSALSRPPSSGELSGCLAHITGQNDLSAGLEDVAWALLNAKEFVFRH